MGLEFREKNQTAAMPRNLASIYFVSSFILSCRKLSVMSTKSVIVESASYTMTIYGNTQLPWDKHLHTYSNYYINSATARKFAYRLLILFRRLP